MRVEFICECCGLESHIEIAKDESVYAGCEAIQTSHAKWSPECTGDLSTIRLLTPTNSEPDNEAE